MPKIGAEAVRRAALIEAAIGEIGDAGRLDVTVGQIARAAGVSPALAHHYFGSKDRIFLAAMREVLRRYQAGVRAGLAVADGPRARLAAVIVASFEPTQFTLPVMRAWMSFYALAMSDAEARRLLLAYQHRLRTTLTPDLRALEAPAGAADAVAEMIDGRYLALVARGDVTDPQAEAARILRALGV